ncbi:MAG: tetratricopeptide repeat protein, partial [Deltaproteobacteria bacterium]|nr:tetratricopeptide repeat protein [Deltaproteobacteria bacterium]
SRLTLLARVDTTLPLRHPDLRAASSAAPGESGVSAPIADGQMVDISSYQRAVQLDPCLTAHWINYERLLARQRRWPDAVAVADRALAVVPRAESVELLLAKANAENEQEQAEAGLSTADAALALEPDHPRALYLRGWALGMLGRLADAQAAMLRLLEIDPTSAAARSALEKIEAVMPPPKPWWKLW